MSNWYGSLKEIVTLVFRTASPNSKEVIITPATQTGTGPITVTIPDVVGSSDSLVLQNKAQTLANKTIDGDDNTVQDLPVTALKTVVGDANKVLRRDASGVPQSGNALPDSAQLVTISATQNITNKTLDTTNGIDVFDSLLQIKDNTTPTKTLVFSVAGNAASTQQTIATSASVARTLTLPDATDTLMGKATADIMTNKTFDANGAGNSITNIENADIAAAAAIDYSKLALSNSIVNADIATGAAIVDTKLATISTASKVSNSATTATSANTASAIVARDGSGNFTAGTITASLTGNASGTAANVTGTVAIANGGTGQTTAPNAINALVPSQTSNSGKVLTTDGSVVSWGASATVPATAGGVYSDGSALQSANLAFAGNGDKVFGINAGGTTAELKSTLFLTGNQTAAGNKIFSGTTLFTGEYSGSVASHTTPTGAVDNMAFTGNAVTINAGVTSITGIAAKAEGTIITLYNQGGSTVTLNMNNVNSSAANRMFSGTNKNVTITNGGPAAMLVYQAGQWNLLSEDREEGSWTPTLTPGGGAFSSLTTTGLFTRNGKTVNVFAYTTVTKNTATGTVTYTGLPYASNSATTTYVGPNFSLLSSITFPASAMYLGGYVAPNTTTINLEWVRTGTGFLPFNAADITSAGAELTINMTYFI